MYPNQAQLLVKGSPKSRCDTDFAVGLRAEHEEATRKGKQLGVYPLGRIESIEVLNDVLRVILCKQVLGWGSNQTGYSWTSQ